MWFFSCARLSAGSAWVAAEGPGLALLHAEQRRDGVLVGKLAHFVGEYERVSEGGGERLSGGIEINLKYVPMVAWYSL